MNKLADVEDFVITTQITFDQIFKKGIEVSMYKKEIILYSGEHEMLKVLAQLTVSWHLKQKVY